jgi:hypothetical protein
LENHLKSIYTTKKIRKKYFFLKGDDNPWNPEANKATKLASVWTYRTGKSSRRCPEVKKNSGENGGFYC